MTDPIKTVAEFFRTVFFCKFLEKAVNRFFMDAQVSVLVFSY